MNCRVFVPRQIMQPGHYREAIYNAMVLSITTDKVNEDENILDKTSNSDPYLTIINLAAT